MALWRPYCWTLIFHSRWKLDGLDRPPTEFGFLQGHLMTLLQAHPVVPKPSTTRESQGTVAKTCHHWPPKQNPSPAKASFDSPGLMHMFSRSPGMAQAGPDSAGSWGWLLSTAWSQFIAWVRCNGPCPLVLAMAVFWLHRHLCLCSLLWGLPQWPFPLPPLISCFLFSIGVLYCPPRTWPCCARAPLSHSGIFFLLVRDFTGRNHPVAAKYSCLKACLYPGCSTCCSWPPSSPPHRLVAMAEARHWRQTRAEKKWLFLDRKGHFCLQSREKFFTSVGLDVPPLWLRKGRTVEKADSVVGTTLVKDSMIISSSAPRSHLPMLAWGQGTQTNLYNWRSWNWMWMSHAEFTYQTLVGKREEKAGWEMTLTWQVVFWLGDTTFTYAGN